MTRNAPGTEGMAIKSLAGWFGSNRVFAERVGAELGKLAWCGVPFAGGCPELPYIDCRGGVANDLHRHLINLARVVRDDRLNAELIARLEGMVFHPDDFGDAQRVCLERETPAGAALFASESDDAPSVEWAAAYFIASWMGRGGHSGKKTEFSQNLAVRWTATGGGSARRFASAVESLPAWHRAFRDRWEFTRLDVFEFLGNCRDQADHGIYADPPWPDAGQEYQHSFTVEQQRRLAARLAAFKSTRVVVRFGDHPLIRSLYPESHWRWVLSTTRDQQNGDVVEALLVNGPPLGANP